MKAIFENPETVPWKSRKILLPALWFQDSIKSIISYAIIFQLETSQREYQTNPNMVRFIYLKNPSSYHITNYFQKKKGYVKDKFQEIIVCY